MPGRKNWVAKSPHDDGSSAFVIWAVLPQPGFALAGCSGGGNDRNAVFSEVCF